jgi:hypothetical protein
VLAQPAGSTAAEGIVLVARDRDVLLRDTLRGPVGGDHRHWGPLPHLAEYVLANADMRQYGAVIVDWAGADFVSYGPRHVTHDHVEGQRHHLHKVGGGAYAHKRIQNRVDEVADRNAALIAEEMERFAHDERLSGVLLAGEVDVRSRVHLHLSPALGDKTRMSERGARAADIDDAHLLHDLVIDTEREIHEDLLCQLRDRMSSGTAVDGAADAMAAFRQQAVDTLLLTTEDPDVGTAPPESLRRIAFGAGPTDLAIDAPALRSMLTADGTASSDDVTIDYYHLDAVLVRAGAASDTTAEAMPATQGGLRDGVGALLRYPVPVT